jgi:hypothetical protein
VCQGLARTDIYPHRASAQGFLRQRSPDAAISPGDQNCSVRDLHHDDLLVDVLDGAVHRRRGSTSAPIQIRRRAAIHRLGPMNIGQRVYLY